MRLRPPKTSDRESICRIHQAAARELGSTRYTSSEIESWVGSLTPSAYELAAIDRHYVIAERESEVLGFGCLNLKGAEIEAVYVAPEAIGRGFGSAILEELERIAAMQDIPSLHLNSSLNAVGFYERAGYTAVERATYRSRGGLELAVVKMFKNL
jgi:putative acetyltransferase